MRSFWEQKKRERERKSRGSRSYIRRILGKGARDNQLAAAASYQTRRNHETLQLRIETKYERSSPSSVFTMSKIQAHRRNHITAPTTP